MCIRDSGGGGEPEDGADLAHAQFPFLEHLHDAEAAGVAECPEDRNGLAVHSLISLTNEM